MVARRHRLAQADPMPGSQRDRCTSSYEYIFQLTKSPRYFFDLEAIKEPASPNTNARISQDLMEQVGSYRANGGNKTNGPMKAVISGSTRKLRRPVPEWQQTTATKRRW